MHKREHILNAVVLSVGMALLLAHTRGAESIVTVEFARTVVAFGVPVTLGALFPDVDTAFGTHRKTLHNLPVLAGFVAFPLLFGNLHYVWIGVASHYVIDLVGSRRGMALLYPWSREFSLPGGVNGDSGVAAAATLLLTLIELNAIAIAFYLGIVGV